MGTQLQSGTSVVGKWRRQRPVGLDPTMRLTKQAPIVGIQRRVASGE